MSLTVTTSGECARETVSDAVFYEVADAEEVCPLDLRPLGEVIDTDALNQLVASMDPSQESLGSLSFAYSGYEVTIFGDESMTLSRFDDQTTPH